VSLEEERLKVSPGLSKEVREKKSCSLCLVTSMSNIQQIHGMTHDRHLITIFPGLWLSLGSSKVFFSPILSLMGVSVQCHCFAFAFGLLSWGNLIFNNIIDLPYFRWTMTQFSSRNKLCCIIFMLSCDLTWLWLP